MKYKTIQKHSKQSNIINLYRSFYKKIKELLEIRALKISNFESFKALKLYNLENFRALKTSNLANRF